MCASDPLFNLWAQRFAPVCSSKSFIVFTVNFYVSNAFLSEFLCAIWDRGPAPFFCTWISSYPYPVIPPTALVPPAPLVTADPLLTATPVLKGSPCLGLVTQHFLPLIFRALFRFFPPSSWILQIHLVPKQVHYLRSSTSVHARAHTHAHPCFLHLSHTSRMPEIECWGFHGFLLLQALRALTF